MSNMSPRMLRDAMVSCMSEEGLPNCTATPPFTPLDFARMASAADIGEEEFSQEDDNRFEEHIEDCEHCQGIIVQLEKLAWLQDARNMQDEVNRQAAAMGLPPIVEELVINGEPHFRISPKYEVKFEKS